MKLLRQMSPETNSNSNALARKIGATPLRTVPFGHIYHEQIFPMRLYREILRQLPDSRFYDELRHPDALQPDGSSARLSFNLYSENIRRLPVMQREFWRMLTREMTAPEVEAAFKAKFKKILEEHCQRKLEKIKLRPWPMLLRDIAGYQISIHPDVPQKAITTQYYLPEDENQKQLGTVLHERLPGGGFNEICTLPFLPDSGYAFPVTTESWHSVKVMNTNGPPRNSLMVTYFYDRGWVVEGFRKLVRRLREMRH
ncbi:MAG TPA: hypothetical protein VG754_10015 [Verrucomicrobiae bacterium]|nr:hypothetical protein [Verrucomicrobiae bacterium]